MFFLNSVSSQGDRGLLKSAKRKNALAKHPCAHTTYRVLYIIVIKIAAADSSRGENLALSHHTECFRSYCMT